MKSFHAKRSIESFRIIGMIEHSVEPTIPDTKLSVGRLTFPLLNTASFWCSRLTPLLPDCLYEGRTALRPFWWLGLESHSTVIWVQHTRRFTYLHTAPVCIGKSPEIASVAADRAPISESYIRFPAFGLFLPKKVKHPR